MLDWFPVERVHAERERLLVLNLALFLVERAEEGLEEDRSERETAEQPLDPNDGESEATVEGAGAEDAGRDRHGPRRIHRERSGAVRDGPGPRAGPGSPSSLSICEAMVV